MTLKGSYLVQQSYISTEQKEDKNDFAANNTECLSWTQDNKFHSFLLLEDFLQ